MFGCFKDNVFILTVKKILGFVTEIKTTDGKVSFSFDNRKTTLATEIGKHKNLAGADLKDAYLRYADLRDADLRGADLRGADLAWANLKGADLRGADLEDANIKFANLFSVNLEGANLKKAYLKSTEIRWANLKGANLTGAKLVDADIRDANLQGADLRDANLISADLQGAMLQSADLEGADLRSADLEGAINVPEIPLACPSEGSFVAWKKVNNFLVKLEIPEDARRSSATSNKCRCDKALVVDIEDLYTVEHPKRIVNNNYCKCVYEVGKMVYPDSFDEDRWNECSHGIHFFMDKQDAIMY